MDHVSKSSDKFSKILKKYFEEKFGGKVYSFVVMKLLIGLNKLLNIRVGMWGEK